LSSSTHGPPPHSFVTPCPGDLTSLHVRRAALGERESQQWLVSRFSGLLLNQADGRLPAAVRYAADPEDVVNDVWLRALDRIPGLQPNPGERMGPTLLRYLSTILIHRIFQILEAHARHGVAKSPLRPAEGQRPWLRVIIKREIHAEVWEAVHSLDETSRRIFIRHAQEGRSYEWIARLEGMTQIQAREIYRRAVSLLRLRLPGSIFDEFDDVGG
jgi:RNA polymerase sigma factor (sigma-70 family)